MKEDIIYVDYELSSWKYLNDNKANSVTMQDKTDIGSYKVLDYYDEEWKIAAERHLTDHNKPHSIPTLTTT